MLKRYLIAAVLGMVVFCGAASAGTEQEAVEQAVAAGMAAMANEPPITQADIDTFLAVAPQAAAVADDPVAIFKVFQDNGISAQRLGVIGPKITVGVLMAQGMTLEQITGSGQFLDFMIPSDAELELITANMEAIQKSLEE